MTAELTYLMLTAILASGLWIPYIVGTVMQPGDASSDFTRPPDLTTLPPWVHRAYRAHLNLLEQLLPFAVVVLVGHTLGVSTTITIIAATIFFWLRIIHAIGMISGLAIFPIRPMIFMAGWATILVIAWQVFANA